MPLTSWAVDDEITAARLNEMVDAFNEFDGVIDPATGGLLIPDGTAALPGWRFSDDLNNGARRLDTDYWAFVAGGGVTGGGTAIRMRSGLKYPQVGMGKMNAGTDNWVWNAVSANTVLAIQVNETDAAAGSTVGMTSTVESQASSGPGSDPFPDSSAGSFFFIQRTGTPNGAGRAIEAHADRDTATDSNVSANSSIVAIEAAIGTRWDGNHTLYNKVVGINLIGTGSGLSSPATAVDADSGVYVHGDPGFLRPFYYLNEKSGAGANDKFIVNKQGRVYAGTGSAANPSVSFVGDEDSGMTSLADNLLALCVQGAEQMRVDSNGLASGGATISGRRMAIYGIGRFMSNNTAVSNYIEIARTAIELTMGVAASGGSQLVTGDAAGDAVIKASQKLWLSIGTTPLLAGIVSGGARLLIDGANATVANRFMFQNLNTNTNTFVGVVPNGTSVDAGYAAYSNSTPTDASALILSVNNTSAVVQSTVTGTGTQRPLTFYIGATPALTIATTGVATMNLGFTNTGPEKISGATAIISPAQLTANTDDWAPTGLATARVIRLSTDISRNITGMVAQSGARLTLINVGAANAVFKHEVTSTGANRFNTPGGADFTLSPSGTCEVFYDATSSRWRIW